VARDLCLFRVLPVIKQTSVYYAAIRSELKASGSLISANDAWIAALARQHRIPIVTRDIHLDRVKNIAPLVWSRKRWNTTALQSTTGTPRACSAKPLQRFNEALALISYTLALRVTREVATLPLLPQQHSTVSLPGSRDARSRK